MLDILKEMIINFQQSTLFVGTKRSLKYEIVRNKAFICIGVRRCGKSTLLNQIIDSLLVSGIPKENILYLNFFDDRLTELKHGNLGFIVDAYYSLYPEKKGKEKVFFFFDELQEVMNWEPFIDRLRRTEQCEIFITGSSSKMLSSEISTQMRGRSISWELFPFSFNEFLEYKKINTRALTSKNRLLVQNAFEEYFRKGGFPEVRDESEKTRILIHQEYYKSILHRDVIERYDTSHPQAVMQAGYRLLTSISSQYSINRITAYLKSIGFKVSKEFVSQCIQWFEDVFFLFSLKKFDLSISKQNVNTKKIYCVDHSLVTSISPGILENKGLLLENLIFTHLRRRYKNIYYYRTRMGNEVDFLVLNDNNQPDLYQVSFLLSEPNTVKREIRSLFEAMSELNLTKSFIITNDTNGQFFEQDKMIQALPAWKFLISKDIAES